MEYISNILFFLILVAGIGYFIFNVRKLIRNIKLGRNVDRANNKKERWTNMIKIALGQSKMVRRPLSGILHIIVYISFVLMNIELLEIIIDGLFGTHRFFQPILGEVFYGIIIGTFELLAICVLISVVVFWLRRNVEKVKRFWNKEMEGWPKNDGNVILYIEMVLMTLFLTMNATDVHFQEAGVGNIISQFIYPFFKGTSVETLHFIEKGAWWLHIIGILCFLNYLYYSKHLHIILAFPNTFFADLNPKGQLSNLESVTNEVKMMMDPDADPYATPEASEDQEVPEKFGASDVADLNWVQLLNAYTCTECGRCTSSCPAHLTGKKLSPRKIMMDTRDRLEEVGKNIDANNGEFKPDGKQLLDNYISREELWACTTCNACVQECPINISPLSIIMDMRRYLVMEESAAPQELNAMMSNVENNGAMWQYSQMDRLNWKDED